MKFAAMIPDAVMTNTLGDDIIYQHTTLGAMPIKAFFGQAVDSVFSGQAHLSENRMQIDVAVADVPGFKKGSVFTHESINYTVDDIVNNDGFFATLLVRK